ncbi:MAG: thermonuclease family protein [Anaerolineae bacterium]
MRLGRKRNQEPAPPEGLAVWTDSLVDSGGPALARDEPAMRIPVWLLVLVLTVWISVILVTAAYLVAYAVGGLPSLSTRLVSAPPGSPTPAVTAAVPGITATATRTRIPTYTPRPRTAAPTPTLEPSPEPTAVEEYGNESPAGEEAPPADEPTAEPTVELPTEIPTETPVPSPTPLPNPHEARLVGVIDGATIEVEYGGQTYRVRFQGILVPNKDNPDARLADIGRRAEELTTLLVQATPLMLEWDATDADSDGALLRYVFAGGHHVGLELVRQGLATVVLSLTDARYQDTLYTAQLAAQNECLGLWTCP